tara:strand:+ start:398 stop:589 length:192 start_codon:yes stop_codon:yes gene_type:complete
MKPNQHKMPCADLYAKKQFSKAETAKRPKIFIFLFKFVFGHFLIRVDLKIVKPTVFSGDHAVF